MAHVLIIDDDPMICEILSRRVHNLGHSATTALRLYEGMAAASAGNFDVVFLDVRLPDGNGLNELHKIREGPSKPEVIIITGAGHPDSAELAVKSGAWDYIRKPFSKKEVMLQLVRALQYRQEKKLPKAPVALKKGGVIGSSPQMNACLEMVAQSAQSNTNVLITGDTGTGKELFASLIHENSARTKRNFVVVDCTVLPEKLVESVLFGHEKGAFTGADKPHDGLIKQAHGGTLFLDEIGELPLSLQKVFLRVLQERRFRPVGGPREVRSDFRLIVATNRDLDAMVKSGQFRQDLLFRLRTFVIELPPLREHIQDVKELTLYYVAKLCARSGLKPKGFSPEFIETLMAYHWPGNVRELINTLESAIAMEPLNPILFPKQLPNHIRAQIVRDSVIKQTSVPGPPNTGLGRPAPLPRLGDLRERSVSELECKYLHDLMSATKGNMKEACRISGLGRARLYELMKKHGVSKPAALPDHDAHDISIWPDSL